MPRTRRAAKTRFESWSRQQRDFLDHTIGISPDAWEAVFDSWEAYGACWIEHREQVMSRFRQRWPGHRCDAWWDFDAPADAEFRLLGHRILGFSTTWFGTFGGCYDPPGLEIYEPEIVVLDRLGELGEGELRDYLAGDLLQDWPLLPEHLRPREVPRYFTSMDSQLPMSRKHVAGLLADKG